MEPVLILPALIELVVLASGPIEPVVAVAAIDLDRPTNFFKLDMDGDF